MRFLTLAGVAAIALLVVGVMLVDEGEVVTLTTVDERGHEAETSLWVVDVDGVTFLRAGDPDSDWLRNLRAHPDVTLERGGVTREVRAVPVDDASAISAVDRAMRRKYGFLDAVVAELIDHTGAVAVRIEGDDVARRESP